MAGLEPAALRLVQAEWTQDVPSPAHDALSPAERRQHLSRFPKSYLGVTRSVEDTPPGESWTAQQLLDAGRASLEALLAAEAFTDVRDPGLYVYQLSLDGWTQTGIVGALAVADYEADRIKVHEQVYHKRAEHLAQHASVVAAQSSPIAVAHRPNQHITDVIAETTSQDPYLDFTMADGLTQRIWPLAARHVTTVQNAFAGESLYLIDGHHRASAALISMRNGGDASMLGAVFSVDQLQNRPFHRVITGGDPAAILGRISEFPGARNVNDGAEPVSSSAATIEFVANGEWVVVPTSPLVETALERLDTWHFEHVIRPELGDVSVEYIAGKRPIAELMAYADEVGGVLALMTAVEMSDLLEIADDGQVMPPKSTYFEPKVRSGVFLREL